MKLPAAKRASSPAPFVKRVATIVFEGHVPHKGHAKAAPGIADYHLSAADEGVYTRLCEGFCAPGEAIVTKSSREIARIMPPATFLEALPRLLKARALTVTFWEHTAATPKFWRKVKSF
jgi:hypothetical protein